MNERKKVNKMKTNERTEKLKEIMNIGFQTKNNYTSNKIGSIDWIVNESTKTTGLLMAQAARNMADMLIKEFDDEWGIEIKEFGDDSYRVFKIMETDGMSTLIEIEVIEWTDLNETKIRINYWESNITFGMDDDTRYAAEMIYEAIAQQLEM